ncbi:MAG TPA: LytTR family DNA-binding domain-containing protein [Chitinophaga sp.]|uniref:LytR/AlgR family response regulator transcription factor n=1 Tax=Chitinophaga sp. TaxID=1869181 RepID=UPI002CE3396B|nr:LytTR family DNA-binding domain-containing protein [Chitinophaga sp.]HVI47249.1 LytTR family DNA-binding domain-containing protein [Chitinophaga sp.]
MINCLLIDDEKAAIEILKNYITKTPLLNCIGGATNAMDGLKILNENDVNLVFLDVRMPDMTGIDFIKLIPDTCKVILTTAHIEYALDGYDYGVVDYLLKPFSLARFAKAVQKAQSLLTMEGTKRKYSSVNDDHIFVKTQLKGKLIKIDYPDIDYIEAVKNYVAIHRGREKILVLITMKELEEILPKNRFIRVHKSFIVPVERIKSVEGAHLMLKNTTVEIPFGDSYKVGFYDAIRGRLL